MFPGKCSECERIISEFFSMERETECKNEVCPVCKERLKKIGWRVVWYGRF